MEIIHHMKDGTVRDSIEGIVIPNGECYRVLSGILEKRGGENQTRKEANQRTAQADPEMETRPGSVVCYQRYARPDGACTPVE